MIQLLINQVLCNTFKTSKTICNRTQSYVTITWPLQVLPCPATDMEANWTMTSSSWIRMEIIMKFCYSIRHRRSTMKIYRNPNYSAYFVPPASQEVKMQLRRLAPWKGWPWNTCPCWRREAAVLPNYELQLPALPKLGHWLIAVWSIR